MYNNKNTNDIKVDMAETKVYLTPPSILRFAQTVEQTIPNKPIDNPVGIEIKIK